VLDTYSDPGYTTGDSYNGPDADIFTDSAMSAVLGETDYTATGFGNTNIVLNQSLDAMYCAGCNGSFLLTFTSTSVGSASGVYGVSFDERNNLDMPYVATVTFGDLSTADYALPIVGFFGITSDELIRSIHIGLANGGTTMDGDFKLDDLRIAAHPDATAVPEEGAFQAVALGTAIILLGLALRRV
jgi:hypothetical protein